MFLLDYSTIISVLVRSLYRTNRFKGVGAKNEIPTTIKTTYILSFKWYISWVVFMS